MRVDARWKLRVRAETRRSYYVLLRAALSAVTRIEGRHLRNVGLTPAERSLLAAIHDLLPCEPSPTQLEEILSVDRKSILRVLRSMAGRGLVAILRNVGERDSRIVLLPRGRDLLVRSRVAYFAARKEIKKWLAGAEANHIEEALQRLTGLYPIDKRMR